MQLVLGSGLWIFFVSIQAITNWQEDGCESRTLRQKEQGGKKKRKEHSFHISTNENHLSNAHACAGNDIWFLWTVKQRCLESVVDKRIKRCKRRAEPGGRDLSSCCGWPKVHQREKLLNSFWRMTRDFALGSSGCFRSGNGGTAWDTDKGRWNKKWRNTHTHKHTVGYFKAISTAKSYQYNETFAPLQCTVKTREHRCSLCSLNGSSEAWNINHQRTTQWHVIDV